MWSDVIPFLGKKDKQSVVEEARKWQPVLEIKLDRKVYRPGDAVTASIEIRNVAAADAFEQQQSIEVRELVVEFRGTEKLDQQWIVVPKPSSTGGKQRIGERLFLHGQSHIVLNKHVERDSSREYLIQTTLPKILPPSYRGTAVRYFYYLTVRLQWSFKARGDSNSSEPFAVPLEKRVSLTMWTLPGFSGLTADELEENYNTAGIVPTSTVEVDMYWKENTEVSEWSRASGPLSSLEDDVSSQGSDSRVQSPVKGVLEQTFERSLLLPSPSSASKSLNRANSRRATLLTASSSDTCIDKEGSHLQAQTSLHRSCSENGVSWKKSADGYISEDGENAKSGSPLAGERHLKGKAYNIKMDNQVLVQISPKNPDATYYFGDTVAGVINFPSDSGLRRKCLEVSAMLEVREILNPSYLHPSRRNSQVISKVHAEYFEIVADVSQTHYIFSIPLDGPASFSTPHISLQWVLRFEFLSTWANADWSKVRHPLQVKERDRGEWVMPITVHAPPPKTRGFRKERPVSSLRDFWMQSPKSSSEWGGTPQGSPSAAAGPSNGHL